MSATPSQSVKTVSRVFGFLQVALMVWAALSTTGALSVALWTFVALCAFGLAVGNV